MAFNQTEPESQWLAVIGKSLAFLCLSQAEMRDKDLVPQAVFLEGLGLSRADAAKMLGTTTNSLSAMMSRARGKGRRHGRKRR